MNHSNKIWRSLLAGTLILLMAGCSNEQQRRLDAMVEEQNAECPIDIDSSIEVEKVSRSGNTVVYDVKVDLPVKPLAENAEAMRRLFSDAIAGSDDPDVKLELEICRDAGATMKYVLTDARGDTFSIHINPADYLK